MQTPRPEAEPDPTPCCASAKVFLIAGTARGYAGLAMKPHGTYKLTHRVGSIPDPIERFAPSEARLRRIVESLRMELSAGEAQHLRIRQIFHDPREIFRLEYELTDLNLQRTTLLDRDALEDLLETDEVRAAFGTDLD